jgi:hypothetical protein
MRSALIEKKLARKRRKSFDGREDPGVASNSNSSRVATEAVPTT